MFQLVLVACTGVVQLQIKDGRQAVQHVDKC